MRLARKWPEAEGIVGLELVAAGGGPLPVFQAGAHIDLHLPGGLVRPYSLCNPPGETHRYCLGVLREPASRGGSAAVHDLLAVGQTFQISTPRNLFALAPDDQQVLLLAGGIGITPILAMAEELHAQGRNFSCITRCAAPPGWPLPRACWACPGCSNCGCTWTMASRPSAWTCCRVVQPGAGPGAVRVRSGRLHRCRAGHRPCRRLARRPAALRALRCRGVQYDSDADFEVQLGREGRVVLVPRGQTVVQALAAAGVALVTSCEQGVCGTCLTRCWTAPPDHRDQYLTPDEQAANDQFLPCCSRACSPRLVLGL